QGTALATDARITIEFPSFVRLLDDKAFEDSTDRLPLPPPAPNFENLSSSYSISSNLTGSFGVMSPLFTLPDNRSLVNALRELSDPKITISNFDDWASIRCTAPKVLHGEPQKLTTVYFWFPKGESPRSFGATYCIRAAEMPQATEANLTFRI